MLLIATATADKPTTFVVLFLSQVLSWAGVPALGAAALAAAGVLASQGEIHLWAVLIVGTLGAQVGSLAGWWMGTRVARTGSGPKGRWGKALTSGARLRIRLGGLMVFLVPAWVSGALGMPFRQFAFWNVWATIAWTLGSGLAAYGVGFAVTGGSALGTVAALAVALAALLGSAALFVRRRRSSERARPG